MKIGLEAVVDQRSACDRSPTTNGWLGWPIFQAMTFNGTVGDRIPAFFADDRFWSAASPRFAALPHDELEPTALVEVLFRS